jgi:S1-C subfamily serine protease
MMMRRTAHNFTLLIPALVVGTWGCCATAALGQSASLFDVIETIQPKVVKVYGSGGLQGLEAYQSGFLISAEGHVLTAWSYVLDAEEYITVVLDDGTHYGAKLLNHDPRLDIAILRIEGKDLPFFNLAEAVELRPGDRVLAVSNLFGIAVGDEGASVLHGNVSAVSQLAARRGAFQSIYRGPIYVLDAMTNNPGAAGGVVTDRRGRLAGMIGKELRSSLDNTWLNFAIPISQLAGSVTDMLAGRNPPRRTDETAKKPANAHTPALLGLVLVPDVMSKTPPFVDRVLPQSPAASAGLRPDDLILFVNNRMVSSCKELVEELSFIDHVDPVHLTIQRGAELLDVTMTNDK